MKFQLDILRMAHALAANASSRQALIAQNTANADTPGYKALDIKPFSEIFTRSGNFEPRATRLGHLGPAAADPANRIIESSIFGAESPNGNTVSLEDQMIRATEVRRQYDLALGVYRKSMDILRLGLGRGR